MSVLFLTILAFNGRSTHLSNLAAVITSVASPSFSVTEIVPGLGLPSDMYAM